MPEVPVLPIPASTSTTWRTSCRFADGVVIGTHFKVDGNTWNAVDGARVKRFMEAVERLR